MTHYCNCIANPSGTKNYLLSKYEKNLLRIVEWYKVQYDSYSNLLQAEAYQQLAEIELSSNKELEFNFIDDYNKNFEVKLSMFCIADILSKHMLSTFSYGPDNADNRNFSQNDIGKSWFEYSGDAVCISEILQDMLNKANIQAGIDLSVLLEERVVRNKLTHAGDISVCVSAIRCYNIIRKMIVYLDSDYASVLPEFEYPQIVSCDMQKFFSHAEGLEIDSGQRTTILVVGSMKDMNKTQLALLANLPWNLVLDFGGDYGSDSLKSLVRHNQLNVQCLSHEYAQNIVGNLSLTQNHTEWFTCGEFLNPFLQSKDANKPSTIEKILPGKYAFYHGKRANYYNDFLKNIMESICKAVCKKLNPVTIVFAYYDRYVASTLLRMCENYFRNISYSFSVVYYWNKDIVRQITNEIYASYIMDDEDFSDRFKVFPTDLCSFLKGLEVYGVNQSLAQREDEVEQKYLPSSDGYKKVPVNLANDLEKYFYVLYKGCGEKNDDDNLIQDFYRGGEAPWNAFYKNKVVHLISKGESERYINKIKTRLGRIPYKNKDKILYLAHEPGLGGSTMLREIGWNLHNEYPVLLIHNYDKLSTKKVLNELYDTVRKSFVVLVDENFDCLEDLERDIKELQRACVLLASMRKNNISNCKVDQLPLFRISQLAETELKAVFRENSSLTKQELAIKDKEYNDFIEQDRESMRSPFMIGLYYMDRDFNRVDEFVAQLVSAVNDKKELSAIGFMALADIYGQIALPKVLINHCVGLAPTTNYLKSHNYMQSVFYMPQGEIACYSSKHYLLSQKLLNQCSYCLYQAEYHEKLAEWSKAFIDMIIEECQNGFQEIYQTILEKIFIKNRIINDEGENQSAFSKLIEDVTLPEHRKEILEYLAQKSADYADKRSAETEPYAYMMTSHFYGHLSRLYCKSGSGVTNYLKAIEYSDLSMKYMEKCGYQDSRVYHMHGETMKNELQYRWEQVTLSENRVTEEQFINFEDQIDNILEIYNLAAQFGSPDYAYTSEISLLVNYLGFVYKCKRIDGRDDFKRLSEAQQQYRLDIESLIDMLDGVEMEDDTYYFYNKIVDKYRSNIMMNDYNGAIDYYQKRLSELQKNDANVSEIVSARTSLVNARLGRYRKISDSSHSYYAGIPKNDVEEILDLLETTIEQSFDITRYISRQQRMALYNRWVSIAKYSTRSIDKGIEIVTKWKKLTELDKRNDPRPYYYLYVLYYLSVLEGNIDNKKYVQEYQVQSAQKAAAVGYKLDVIKDVILVGKGMAQLCDVHNIKDLGNVFIQPEIKFKELQGRFVEVVTKKGIVELTHPMQWMKVKAKFRILERNTLGNSQIMHNVKFYAGFSYEQITAIDSTVKDVTVGEDFPQFIDGVEEIMIKEDESIHKVKFYPEYIDYDYSKTNVFYLNGKIENGKFAGLSSKDIDKFGDELSAYGDVQDVMYELRELPSFYVRIITDNGIKCKVSLYETKIALNNILVGKCENALENVEKVCNVREENKDLPIIKGSVVLKNCKMENGRISGTIEVEGKIYPAVIVSVSNKKSKMLKNHATINAKVKGISGNQYILQL